MKIAFHAGLSLVFLLFFNNLFAQNWPTIGGNSRHDGQSRMPGPTAVNTPAWTVNSEHYTAWGNAVYLQGDRFVNTRTQISPDYVGQIECRRLSDGALLWEKDFDGGIPYAVGFDEYAVYVHDYADDAFYALDPADGAVRWQHDAPVSMFGGNAGIVFACNGDPVVFGKRLDKFTGETVWASSYLIPIGPDGGFAAHGDTYYHWEGTVVSPIRLIALDLNSGQLKYKSDPLPGDPDQEMPLTIGPDGTIYITRDGGQLLAFRDTGAGFELLWASNHAPQSRLAAGQDNMLYYFRQGRFFRIAADGQALDSTAQSYAFTSPPLIATDADGRVYATNGAFGGPGRYLCFTPDLQLLWTRSVPTNYYAGPAFGRAGTMVLVGEGTELKAYRFQDAHAPVADFQADTAVVSAGEVVGLQDFSSFGAESWQWFFPGGTPAFSTEQNPAVTYDAPGVYDVTLVVSNALGADTLLKTCYLDVRESSPATDIATNFAVRIFPNPAREAAYVAAPEGSRLRVWSLADGRLKWEASASSRLELSAWLPGLYAVEVSRGRKVWREKLTVVR